MAGESSVCGACGEPIIGEDPAQRKPCPKCGSTSRKFGLSLHVTSSSSVTVQAEVVTYPQRLIAMARSLIDEGQFSFAVVVSHTACEIATERSLYEAFAAKGLQDLQDWVQSLNYGYNLANDRIRRLYTALTGDEIQKEQPFWSKFKKSADRRNRIVHKGVIVEKPDAEESYKAADELVARLKKYARLTYLAQCQSFSERSYAPWPVHAFMCIAEIKTFGKVP